MRFTLAILFCFAAGVCLAQVDPHLYDGMRWRMIGPFRGGRTVAATGVPGHAGLYYIGVNNGGVWKTDDFGRTWNPIFDDQPTGSIGALTVAPSDPSVIYVGSGEGIQRPDLSTGDGLYRSNDAGKSWKHLGLRDGQQIGAIIVDPTNPNLVFVAVLGHPYGPNEERGVFRSTDGGGTFQKVLYKDQDTGAIALAFDPANPRTIYADLFASRQAPWENGVWYGPNSGLFKSTDGGDTWTKLSKGLPTYADGLGRIGFGVSASSPNRLYAVVEAQTGGVFRSDDAGESWKRVNEDPRLWGRGSDFAEIKIDPKDPDTVYVANTSTYRSKDGGATWEAIKGAPGGDDYHTVWIDPQNSDTILLACDQGAVVSVNGGRTWSSWYNQPTAQFYHVATDNQFPYWVYGGQQESGSVGTSSRGNDGQITFREWHPVGAEEYAYIAPDPLDPNIVFGGKVSRYDKTTGQSQDVSSPEMRQARFLRTAPLLFSQADPHTLFLAGNKLFKTRDGGHSWQVISPDLTRPKPDGLGVFQPPAQRGVIYAVGPSPRSIDVIWAGTDDGLIHVTRDGGKSWINVTPPSVNSWSKIAQIDAGHFDTGTAYVAVNRMKLDDWRPHVLRTHDGGKSWTETVNGLPSDAPVNVVREDPVRKGLLYAGTEHAVFFSLDDGAHWQPLRLNMPATSIRDLVVHDVDLVVGTHGRSFWILDDITPLRQIDLHMVGTAAMLYRPAAAIRVHPNNNTDTPLPPEEPGGQNPPEGAIIDFVLPPGAQNVTLGIYDGAGKLVRQFSNKDPQLSAFPRLEFPMYWVRSPRPFPSGPGFHRFTWSLQYPALNPGGFFTMGAILHDTPTTGDGPWVAPGQYTVRLSVDGVALAQPLTVKMDPRLKTPPQGIALQTEIGLGSYNAAIRLRGLLGEIGQARARVSAKRAKATGAEAAGLDELDRSLSELAGASTRPRGRRGRGAGGQGLAGLAAEFEGLSGGVEDTDGEPTQSQIDAYKRLKASYDDMLAKWKTLQGKT